MANWAQRAFRDYVAGPEHPAKLRVVRRLWRWFVPADGALFDIGDNLQMWLHPEDQVEKEIYERSGYEVMTHEFLAANIHSGIVAIFAGANTGLHLIFATRPAGEQGKVIGVEPQPLSLHRAMQNIEANDLKNVVLVAGGLGEKDTIVPMAAAQMSGTGHASFVLREPGCVPFQIGVWRYDTLLDQLQLPPVDLMLLDVEGYELPVLRGMSPSRRPTILIIEIHPIVLKMLSQSDANYYEALRTMGYSTWTLTGTPANSGMLLPDNNLVCVREGAPTPVWSHRENSSA